MLKHNCGLGAVFNSDHAIRDLYVLGQWNQHRGNEGAGFSLYGADGLELHKDYGSTHEVFIRYADQADQEARNGMQHNRYSLTGESTRANVQPFLVERRGRMVALGHNGNLVNFEELDDRYRQERRQFHVPPESDSGLMAIMYALEGGDLVAGTQRVFAECVGSYNLIVMNDRGEMAVVRDPAEVSPLFMAQVEDRVYVDSENFPLIVLGQQYGENWSPLISEVEGGTMSLITEDGVTTQRFTERDPHTCPFQRVYFELDTSSHGGALNRTLRIRLGEVLHERYGFEGHIVAPALDSGWDYGVGVSNVSGIPLTEGLIKNRYLGRTYTSPVGKGEHIPNALRFSRREVSRMKNAAVPLVVQDKNVIVSDDSLVRKNVAPAAAEVLFAGGADQVGFYFGFPPVRYPCLIGMDHASRAELAAAPFESVEEANEGVAAMIAEQVGVDRDRVFVGYITPEELEREIKSVQGTQGLCTACYSGEYFFDLPDVPRIHQAMGVLTPLTVSTTQ